MVGKQAMFGSRKVSMQVNLKCLASVAAFAAVAASSASQAEEWKLRKSFRLYGHFTPAVISYDDGANRYNNAADNSYSPGRIGFWLELPSRKGRTRFNLETSLGLRQSSSLNQLVIPPLVDLDRATLRKLEFIFDTDRFGSFSFGQGSMGSDGVTESDLSGTQLAAYVGIADTAGGYSFRTGAGTLSTVTVSEAYPTFDGGRAPRIRWDSPDLVLSRLGTFKVAASAGVEVKDGRLTVNDTLGDVGVFYRNRVGAFEFKSSGGFSVASVDGALKPQASGSFSLLHSETGLSASLAVGARQDGGQYTYTKIALKRHWIDWGDTSVSIDYYNGVDTVESGSLAESFGIGLVQNLDRSNLQFYLGFRRYTFDSPKVIAYRPANSIIFGTRWVFKKLETARFGKGRSEVDWNEGE